MIGTILNVLAILLGGAAGLTLSRQMTPQNQVRLKYVLGVLTIYAGFSTTWKAINGPFLSIVKQIIIALAAIVLGNAIGKSLRFQKSLNKLAQYATRSLAGTQESTGSRFGEGFLTCTILFCVGPMAMIGSIQDGLSGNFRVLAIKSVMDGLASMAFARTFGVGVLFSAIPVLAYQGSLTLAAKGLEIYLQNGPILDSVNAAGGLLIVCMSLVILEVAKVPLADYMPSLAVAPLLTALWK